MRQSQMYNSYLTGQKLEHLVNKYELIGCLAVQDFWTIMSMEHRQLFSVLDCTWNRQLDEMYGFVEHFGNIFNTFHRCDGDIKIFLTLMVDPCYLKTDLTLEIVKSIKLTKFMDQNG